MQRGLFLRGDPLSHLGTCYSALAFVLGFGACHGGLLQRLESLGHDTATDHKKKPAAPPRCSTFMLHLTLELLRGTAIPEYYGTVAAAIVLALLIHTWARGPALQEREERIEAQQQRAHEKNGRVRVTAGLTAMGGRTVLIGVRHCA